MSSIAKYVFGYVTWHQYMTRLQRTVAQGAAYQAAVTHQTGLMVADEIRGVSDEVRELSAAQAEAAAATEIGLSLISERLADQTTLLEEIYESLAKMQEALSAPQRTKAREQFRIGAARLKGGLLREALDAFHRAEEINGVDPTLQLAIGKIYLYGIDEGEPLIDLGLAKKHLLLASRYCKLCGDDSEEGLSAQLRGEVHYHAATLFFILASEERLVGGAESADFLQKAAEHCAAAIEEWPHHIEYRYLLSKILACDGETLDLAAGEMVVLFSLAPYYAVLADQDENFAAIRDSIGSLVRRATEKRISFAAHQLSVRMHEAEEKAKESGGPRFAPERFAVLVGIRRRIEAEITDGTGYRPEVIVRGLKLAAALYELALACQPCATFRDEVALAARQLEEQSIRTSEVRTIRENLAVAMDDVRETGWLSGRLTRALVGSTPGDRNVTHLRMLLSSAEARLELLQKEMRAKSSSRRIDAISEQSFSVQIEGLSKTDQSLIKHCDDRFDEELNDLDFDAKDIERQLLSDLELYKLKVNGLFRQTKCHTNSDARRVEQEIVRQYLAGDWKPIDWQGITGVDLKEVNRNIGWLASRIDFTFRQVFGFDPILFRMPYVLCDDDTHGLPHTNISYSQDGKGTCRVAVSNSYSLPVRNGHEFLEALE